MKLLLPEWVSENLYKDYVASWGAETIVPAASDPKGRDYSTWLSDTIKMRTITPPGLVPATLFFLVDDAETKILGGIDIRHRLNDYLMETQPRRGRSRRSAACSRTSARKTAR